MRRVAEATYLTTLPLAVVALAFPETVLSVFGSHLESVEHSATTLRVVADGNDVVVTVVATDEDGSVLPVASLEVPPTADLEAVEGGVRVKHAVRAA